MKVEVGRLINVAGDDAKSGKKGAAFCRFFFMNETYYAVFTHVNFWSVDRSPNVISYVRGFDQNFQFTGFEKQLTPKRISDGDPTIAFDGENFYQLTMTDGGRVRKFDKEFNLVKQTPPFKKNFYERITDPNIAVINGKIYVGTEYREEGGLWLRRDRPQGMQNIPIDKKVDRSTHQRIFDIDLNLLEERDLIANIEGAEVPNQYWGMGTSQLYAEGYYCVVVHTPIGNTSYFKSGESVGARQIFILRFDDAYNFVDSKGLLSNSDYDNFWCTGSWYEDGRYYISYTYRKPGEGVVPGPPGQRWRPERPGTISADSGNIRLGIFDEDFNELTTLDITKIKANAGVVTAGAHRSHILKRGNKLFVTYDIDTCGKAMVQELNFKE